MLAVLKFVAVLALWAAGGFVAILGLLLLLNVLAPAISFAAAVVVVVCVFACSCLGIALASSRRLPRP